jgi:hypothetical protein
LSEKSDREGAKLILKKVMANPDNRPDALLKCRKLGPRTLTGVVLHEPRRTVFAQARGAATDAP